MERLLKVLFFVGLFFYFVVLVVARIPAEWGAKIVTDSVPGLSLGGVSGTLWDGKAVTVQVVNNGQILDLGHLQWKLKPSSLLALKACVDVKSQIAQGDVCHGLDKRTHLSRFMVDQVPANLLNRTLGVQLSGTANAMIRTAELSSNGELTDLDGNITWQNGAINAGTGWFALGSFVADVTDNDQGGIRGTITDLEGDFTVQLDGEYDFRSRQPRVKGLITPKESAAQPLKDALSVFTEMQDDGSFKVTWPFGAG